MVLARSGLTNQPVTIGHSHASGRRRPKRPAPSFCVSEIFEPKRCASAAIRIVTLAVDWQEGEGSDRQHA